MSRSSFSEWSVSTATQSIDESDIYGWIFDPSFCLLQMEMDNPVPASRAREIISQLPKSTKINLLAPITDGFLDPQSVIKIKHAASSRSEAIRVTDFLQIVSNELNYSAKVVQKIITNWDDGNVPERLLDAARRLAETEIYDSIQNTRSGTQCTNCGDNSSMRNLQGLLPFEPGPRKVRCLKNFKLSKRLQYIRPLIRRRWKKIVLAAMLLTFMLVAGIVTFSVLHTPNDITFINSTAAPPSSPPPITIVLTTMPAHTASVTKTTLNATSKSSISWQTAITLPKTTMKSTITTVHESSAASEIHQSSTAPATRQSPLTTIRSSNVSFVSSRTTSNQTTTAEFPTTATITADGYCTSNSTQFPSTMTAIPGMPNEHFQCRNGSLAWPHLWLDVVLLIENSRVQEYDNFKAMIEQIKEIWAPDSGGPVIGQGTARTRVAVVTFDTDARVMANLDQLNSNDDLINVLSGIGQTSAVAVDGSNALLAAGDLFGPNKRGDRPNAPNVIIIYTADWGGPDPCLIAYRIQEQSVILAVTFQDQLADPPSIQTCVYSPGELHQSINPGLDETILESLSYVNCFCIGQNMPGNHDGLRWQKTSQVDHEVWYQYWNPRADKGYYLRDKWAECVQVTTYSSSSHDTAQALCHNGGSYLPNEFSLDKHQFLRRMAQVDDLLTMWLGLQYHPVYHYWYWDYFDSVSNHSIQTMASPNDYINWNCNQPDTSDFNYCVRESPGTINCPGFRWTTTRCCNTELQYHNQLCQQTACDALKYCTDY